MNLDILSVLNKEYHTQIPHEHAVTTKIRALTEMVTS